MTVNTSLYRRVLGREPNRKVRGYWFFAIGSTRAYDDITLAFETSSGLTYSEACKEAKAEAKRLGTDVIYVLP